MSPDNLNSEDQPEKTVKGIGVSSGIAIGKVYLMDHLGLYIMERSLKEEEVKSEVERFITALSLAKEQILEIKEKGLKDLGPQYTYILDTQIMMIEDSLLRDSTIQHIENKKVNVEWALKLSLENILSKFNKIKNEYINERKKDIEQAVNLIFSCLLGHSHESLKDLDEAVIVIAHDLSPSDTLEMRKEKVLAFATDVGGSTSHAGIMASALDIPAVVGLKNISEEVHSGQSVIVDGNNGLVILNPDKVRFRDYLEKMQRYKYFEKKLLKTRDQEAITIDGHSVSLMANIEYSDELTEVAMYGAQGVGLYRTEYLFINCKGCPSEMEQFEDYKKIAIGTKEYYAIIRTLDLGGDKILDASSRTNEVNPALGLRGIRFCLSRVDIFKTQLRAILRASHFGNLKIMYPMVSDVSEIRKANSLLNEAMKELDTENISYDRKIEVGAMIETPAAALSVEILAEEVDFFSIGTNDLIQYIQAVDRDNEQVGHLYQPFNPSILRIIRTILTESEKEGIPVSVCGMMGSDPISTLVLLGLGKVNAISMDPHSIPIIKKLIRNIHYSDAILLSQEVLKLKNYEDILNLVKSKITNWGIEKELYFDV